MFRGKTMVHEWAKVRWGVYEEHGYPGDPKFPLFFWQTAWTVAGPSREVAINFCLNSPLVGYEQVKTGNPLFVQKVYIPGTKNCFTDFPTSVQNNSS